MVSSSGSRVFKIEGYSRTKDGLGGGIISSPVFVVEGHDWQIKYYPSPSWASVSLVLVATDGARVPVNASFRLLKHSGGSWLDSSYGENLKAGTDVSLQSYMCEQRRAKNAGLSMTKDAVLVGNGLELGLGEPEIMAQLRLDQWACLKDDCLKVSQHFGDLLSAGKGVDLTFEVSGEMFGAHRCVLAARSSVFLAELFGPMKENGATRVRSHDMDLSVFKAMLPFIYTDSLLETSDDSGEATIEMTQHLLVAADRYNLERLKLLCEENLCSRVSTSTAATMLALSREHGCHGLEAACFKFLSSVADFQATILTDEFEHLQKWVPNILKELIANLAP
ncbi:hypothetical protein BRADI_4g13588v3 [Brachypodium distachyon]|uniref:BTB domain-containing protein n=1 Tax=Brachypodium distachyon TaxID=15368 RepID=A0A0Q3EJC1_BRADI|nr:hypothetical protein BRADI_4g13588v3 [Brachypodium distachyon]